MCSIIGITGQKFTVDSLLSRLKRMEYRGYDSFGYWDSDSLVRQIGQVNTEAPHKTTMCIGHTRWATHGKVTEQNAHPHRAGGTTIVHNGIIENWKELKEQAIIKGAEFKSETDSEVIAWFIEQERQKLSMEDVLEKFIKMFKGTFATVIMIDGDNHLYAAKRGSPLLFGKSEEQMFFSSDIYAFSDVTNKAIVFDDDEYAVISPDKHSFYKNGKEIQKEFKEFTWVEKDLGLGDHKHHMHKEIYDQPGVSEVLVSELTKDSAFNTLKKKIQSASKVVFTACGTAYFAALIGSMSFHEKKITAQALIASEFEHFAVLPKGSLVIAVSQSGETMDVIKALTYAKKQGADIASIVNVPFSTVERLSEISVKIHAGKEIAVASTKAFTNQAITLLSLAGEDMHTVPQAIADTLTLEKKIIGLAKELSLHEHMYVLGRKYGYPVAREIALKIKEVSYIHAEGMMAGELKHGTIALIEEGTPVIGIVYDNDVEMLSSLAEVEARGAKVIVIGTNPEDDIPLVAKDEKTFCLLAAIIGQLFAYHLASFKGCSIDKPRNLAKSVTV